MLWTAQSVCHAWRKISATLQICSGIKQPTRNWTWNWSWNRFAVAVALGVEVGGADCCQWCLLYYALSLICCLPLSLSLLFLFFLCSWLFFKGATLKVAGCQDSHAFASFSLSTATFFLFMAPAPHSAPAFVVVNSLLSLAVCQLATIASRLLPLAKLKLLL